jgi:hypothetical protein
MAQQNRSSPSKKVGFSREVRVRPCLSVFYDYAQSEIEACWYNGEERRQIREDVRKNVKLMARGQAQDETNNSICTRGLESQIREEGAISRRQHNRRAAFTAVFQEQQGQIEENILDEDSIAMIYSRLAAGSKVQACMIGLADQFESRALCCEIDKKPSSRSYTSLARRGHRSISRQRITSWYANAA